VQRRWLILGVLAAAVAAIAGCGSFGPPDMSRAFEGRPAPVEQRMELPGGRALRSFETGRADGPLVLFVHGSPGAWNDFAYVMADPKLAARAKLVSVDRIGWGGSAAGGLEPRLREQAAALAELLRSRAQGPAVVVGHSYGGPVAAQLALDAPELVAAVVLVAASVDPALEDTLWWQSLGRTVLVRAILPDVLRRADDEIAPLRAELEQLEPRWPQLRLPVFVLQGLDDGLVPPANADFVERVATHTTRVVERIPDQGHLIPWERPVELVELIHRALDSVRAPR
jgi:pimeloyl-ACP methyl ester carboxylesterase